MHIISGKFKGKRIKRPLGIRPTQDKVRKALFDILSDIKGLSFLDLYAGSGAVGLEALSQGVSRVVFVESSRKCIAKIHENLAALGLASDRVGILSRYLVIALNASKAIEKLHRNREKFDIVFMDPPYYHGIVPRSRDNIVSCSGSREGISVSLSKKALKMLLRYDILFDNGLLVCQHFKRDVLSEVMNSLKLIKQAKYGDTVLSFYKKKSSV